MLILVVGGSAMLTPETMPGVSVVIWLPDHAVANVVVAEMAKVFDEVDHISHYMERDDFRALAHCCQRGSS